MTITYGPPVGVHPDRIGANRSTQRPLVKWLILHTSEQSGAEDPNDAEDLGAYMRSPGDRPRSNGGSYGSSYHGITDTDRILPVVPDELVAYAAGGANQYGLHLCMPVKAGQTRDQWLDHTSRPYIRQAAEWIVDKANRYRLPLERISSSEMAGQMLGYADHWTASRAFGKSSHTDCGANFPWDVLAADIATITKPAPAPPPPEPPQEHPDMTPVFFRIEGAPIPVWVTTDGVVAFQVQGPTFGAVGNPSVATFTQAQAAKLSFVDTLHPAVVGVK